MKTVLWKQRRGIFSGWGRRGKLHNGLGGRGRRGYHGHKEHRRIEAG